MSKDNVKTKFAKMFMVENCKQFIKSQGFDLVKVVEWIKDDVCIVLAKHTSGNNVRIKFNGTIVEIV